MVLRKPPSITIVLNCSERKQIADFVHLLVIVDKQAKAKVPVKIKKSKKKIKTTQPTPRLRRAGTIIRAIMIDTIVLTLPSDMYQITNADVFMPAARWALAEHTTCNYWTTSKQNPTQKELRKGIYKPRLTLARRMNLQSKPKILLRVELSLPKLIYGNNFNELQYKDFAPLCTKLAAVLHTM